MRLVIYTAFLFLSVNVFGQKPFREVIETDSSHIVIIRNSIYRCYEETYKKKDSIWWSVSFIDDTTQLNTEGWKTKSGKYLGTWKEYNRQGKLMYTWNHNTGSCVVNKSLYPYHELLERMKAIADSLIISVYSEEFFEKHVRFDYNCYAYDKDGPVGSWTVPMERKPTKFLLRYSVRLSGSEWFERMIGMSIDSNGKYIPEAGYFDACGFEKVKSEYRTFNIDKNRAIVIAKEHGLIESDSSEIREFLTWESFKKEEFYNGQFQYYITEYTGKKEYIGGNNRKGIIFRYNVYSFNPWTGEFKEKKKMKSIKEWGSTTGHSTRLMPDID